MINSIATRIPSFGAGRVEKSCDNGVEYGASGGGSKLGVLKSGRDEVVSPASFGVRGEGGGRFSIPKLSVPSA